MSKHACHRCVVHDVQGPFRPDGGDDAPELETLETTFADGGEEIFFTSGYSAREIAQRHVREHGGVIYVNNVSRKIKRRDLTVSVGYAVAKTAIYTLRAPDEHHAKVYRAYWPPL